VRERTHRRPRRLPLTTLILCLAVALTQCTRQPSPPNVFVLVVDALRADHLGLYGYPMNTSPRLAEYAKRGVVFDRAYAQAPSTFPSTAVMLVSQYPSDVQLVSEHAFQLGQEWITLPEVLQDAGYRTAFFTANPLHAYDSFSDGKSRSHGFEQGFDEFFAGSRFYSDRLRARELNERVMEWIAQDDAGKPFLALVWYVDPHTPYEPPEEFRALFPDSYEGETDWNKHMGKLWATGESIPEEARQHLISLYDAEIAYADASIGEILDELDEEGVLRNTMLIVTADHGEAFHEHGTWVHGLGLYEELIRVPLIIIPPGGGVAQQTTRNTAVVGHIDLMPTILDYAGVPSEKRPHTIRGLSLKPFVEGKDTIIGRRGLAAEFVFGLGPGREPGSFTGRAFVTERFKLMQISQQGELTETRLFDLLRDPGEQHSLSDDPSFKGELDLLTAQLNRILKPREPTAPLSLPEHVRDRLRAVGYL